jgi:chemotaxis protein MotB
MKKLIVPAIAILLLSSCVSSKMYNELEARKKDCDTRNAELSGNVLALTTRNTELENQLNDLRNSSSVLTSDTLRLGAELRRLRNENQQLTKQYEDVVKNGVSGTTSQEAARQLIRDLQKTRENLQQKEDELRAKEAALNAKQDSLQTISAELKARNRRVYELESMLNAKDSTMRALKNNLVAALLGYKDKGMTVEMKNGKVYVMLEERLLFATGSTAVDPKGVEALRELGKVLEKNPDINVLIEGHTDDVPMKGSGEIKDNWDLSVMRSTSVVKILLNGSKIAPTRITAAGRGEYSPLDPSKTVDGRRKNRRIEVILTPKLDEILKVLETN